MDTIKTKAAIAAQISKLNASQNVQQAKSWWTSLTPMQKALAIGIISGLAWGSAAYLFSVGSASAVVHPGGIISSGATITSAQAFWNAVVAGTVAGTIVGFGVYQHYNAAATPVIEEAFDINS